MKRRLTGVSGPWGGLQWDTLPGDKEACRRVVRFLEDRRLLFGLRHVEDEDQCIQSAIEIRHFLTEVLGEGHTSPPVDQSLVAMRLAFRRFVEVGGPNGRDFRRYDGLAVDPFSLALGELRAIVGQHVGIFSERFHITVEEDLLAIVPQLEDSSIIPGFETET